MTIRLLTPADAALLDSADDDVFDNPADARLSAEFLADPRHHLAAAVTDGRLVGFASAVHYVHPDKAPELWINEVGVAPAFQRQGVGRRLLDALFAQARKLGCREAWVLTEEDNSPARALYRAAGGSERTVVYATFDLGG